MILTDRIKKTRLNLVLDAPFFGSLAFKLDITPDATAGSALTDGKTIRLNPEFAASLSDSQLSGLVIECILHCAQGHLWRRGIRELGCWNKACDQVAWEIISGLQQATDGRVIIPPNVSVDPAYVGLSAEEVYHQLKSNKESLGGGENYQSPGAFGDPAPDSKGQPGEGEGDSKGDGQGDGEGEGDADGQPTPQPQPSLEDEWKSAVSQAATVERQSNRGNLPSWMKQLVHDLIEPKVPWSEHVREFCHRLSRDDYSHRRPNRRFLSRGFVLPTLMSEKLGPIVGAFDTSGSIFGYPQLVQAILSEFQGVLDLCRPEMMRLVDCDTQIHQQREFTPGDNLLSFVPQGGGGTDFRPVFEAIEAMPEPPACLIFLTDMEGSFPDTAPEYPVLWANFGNPKTKAPFGHTIHVPIDV
ncbi:MAG: VWA-like domain-containing protein [Verrucomicrobiota bacterium]